MNHTPFILASYLAFAIFLGLDVLLPILKRRRLLRSLAQRLKRQKTRSTS